MAMVRILCNELARKRHAPLLRSFATARKNLSVNDTAVSSGRAIKVRDRFKIYLKVKRNILLKRPKPLSQSVTSDPFLAGKIGK